MKRAVKLTAGVILVAASAVGLVVVLTNDGRDRGAASGIGLLLALGLGLLGWRPRADDPGADPAPAVPDPVEDAPSWPSRVWRSYRSDRRSITWWYDALMLRLVVGILLLVGVVKLLTLL